MNRQPLRPHSDRIVERQGWRTKALAAGLICIVSISAGHGGEPKVPAGFEITLAAASPIVERPVMVQLDDRGRLYVVDSAGVNLRFEELQKSPPHRIAILEDTDHDGQYDKRTLFADQLVMPQGVLPYRGAVYVASPPSVWKLEDTDGDDVADKRTEIVTEFGSNGNAADIHGPFLGPDGWLYLCDGRHGHKVKRPDGTFDEGLAGGIFRFRTDGSGFERVCGGGFDNPVEIDFTAAGEILGTVNILHGNPRQDCLMHWVEGGVYPRTDQEQCLAEFTRTGDLLPPIKMLGHVAVAGMLRYRGAQLGTEIQDSLFITLFNRHKVIRSTVTRSGATFTSQEEEFLTSDDPDFHPTDLLEDADGSLLVVNTGGWFRIGCPQSQIAKPDVLGGIYRIRKSGTPRDDCGGTCHDLASEFPDVLVNWLDDSSAWAQQQAIDLLAVNGAEAVPELKKVFEASSTRSRQTRINAVWALSRINTGASVKVAIMAARDVDPDVRAAAIQALGAIGNESVVPVLIMKLADTEPHVRRAAAAALGRLCGDPAGSEPPRVAPAPDLTTALLQGITAPGVDRFLEHALLHTLIQIADRKAAAEYLTDASPRVRRAALIALDQMPGGELTRAEVIPLLDTDEPALRAMVLQVISRRPGWSAEIVSLLRERLLSRTAAVDGEFRALLMAQSTEPEIQQLVAERLSDEASSPAVRVALCEIIQRAPVRDLPAAWIKAIGQRLADPKLEVRQAAVTVVAARQLVDFDATLREIAADPEVPNPLRIDALAAAAGRGKGLSSEEFQLLMTPVREGTAPPLTQLAAARGLAESPLTEAQLLDLTRMLPKAGPLTITVLIRAFGQSRSEPVGLALVEALATDGTATVRQPDQLAAILGKYPATVQMKAAPLLKSLGTDPVAQKARLQELSGLLTDGDPELGRAVFFSQRAACSSCHAAGTEGGRIGPDLTKIGAARTGNDLLEAIVFPSASFAREFQTYQVVTNGGKSHAGVLGRQTADAIYLRTAELAEIRVGRDEIDEMVEGSVSIMPQGLDKILTAEELRNLLAFLKEQK